MKKLLVKVLGFFNVMVIECAWCPDRRIIGIKRGGKGVTSGMCRRCYEKESR